MHKPTESQHEPAASRAETCRLQRTRAETRAHQPAEVDGNVGTPATLVPRRIDKPTPGWRLAPTPQSQRVAA